MKLTRKKIATGKYELADEDGNVIARAEQRGVAPENYHWYWELVNGWYFGTTGVRSKGVNGKLVLAVIEIQDKAEEYGLGK